MTREWAQKAETAIAHDWLNGMRGGEKCLESIVRVFPDSRIYTLFHKVGAVSQAIESKPIRTSFLQSIPGAATHYKYFLPLFPAAIELFNVSGSPAFVISTSHCVAKGIRPPRGLKHICYCFTPMRYAWLFFDEYFGKYPKPVQALIRRVLGALREWDKRTSARVTHFIAISEHVKKRIQEFYGRDATVIYPPVDAEFYTPPAPGAKRDGFYLLVSALVPYKRVELAIEAFNRLGKKLVIIGTGPERKKLEALAGPTIEFGGWKDDASLRDFYRSAAGLIFPGEEDFGIVPVEAQACGLPVIAYKKGGALETIVEGRTGLFFKEPTTASLVNAVRRFETISWESANIRAWAERFDRARFENEFREAALGLVGAPA